MPFGRVFERHQLGFRGFDAELGRRRFIDGARDDALALSPIYYRPNEAEARRRVRSMRKR